MGFVTPNQARKAVGRKTRRLMVATEGESDTGKTEFMFSAPGPGMVLAWDRGFDAMCDNPTPPPSRRSDFGMKVIQAPSSTQFASAADYVPYWLAGLKSTLDALSNPDATTVGVDGDNISWELQRLAEHGKLTGVFPQTKYTDVYAARRALYFRMWDSGKIIIATNMMRNEFRKVVDANGAPVLDSAGEQKKEPTGEKVAQGFPDQEYLWQIRIRHLYTKPVPPKWNPILRRNIGGQPGQWGLRITKAKANPSIVGQELWGASATFEGLVSTVYPHIDPVEWGL